MIIERKRIIHIEELINSKINDTFDIETQYKFIQLLEYVGKEVDIIRKQLNLLMERYGEKDENGVFIILDGGTIKCKPDCKDTFQEEINKLYEFSVTLPDIYFNLDELRPLNFTLKELIILKPFIRT